MAGMALLPYKATWVNKAKTLAFWILAVLAVASIGSLLAAKPAHADTIRVNSMEDAGDNNPGNGTCATVPFPVGTEPNCTLRAAIQESNANGESDTIVFDSFLSGTITLTLGKLFVANDIVAHDLSIQGPGARKITVSGNDASGDSGSTAAWVPPSVVSRSVTGMLSGLAPQTLAVAVASSIPALWS